MITKALTTFVLVGTIDSTDDFLATVEINMNPATEQSGYAVIPLTAFPCEIKEGDTIYVLKLTPKSDAVIMCVEDNKSNDGD